MRIFFLFLITLILLVSIGQAVATAKPQFILVAIIGLVLSALTIMNLEWGLYILIFIIPFTLQYRMGKTLAAGTDDIFLILLIFSWLANRARTREQIFVDTPLNWPFISFFLIGTISLTQLISNAPQFWVNYGILHLFRFFEYVFIYFIVVSCIKELPQVRKFTIAFFINVGVVAAIQIVQNIIGGELAPGVFYAKNTVVHYGVSTFRSNAILGTFYCFALSIALGLIVTIRSVGTRAVLIIFSIVISFTLFNTFSRAAYVGIIVSIFIIAVLKERRVFILFLALLILSPIFMQTAVLERIAMTFARPQKGIQLDPLYFEQDKRRLPGETYAPIVELPRAVQLDPSALVRLVIWRRAMEIFMENPIFGIGWWGGRYVLGTEAHSQYWAYLVEVGIFGFGIFLWLMIRIFRISLWVKNNASDDFAEGLGLGYVAGLAGILTTCLFSESLEAFRMLGPLWFMTALVVSARNILLNQKIPLQDLR